jgi:hypothetical protein
LDGRGWGRRRFLHRCSASVHAERSATPQALGLDVLDRQADTDQDGEQGENEFLHGFSPVGVQIL